MPQHMPHARFARTTDFTAAATVRNGHPCYSAVQCDLYPQLLMERAMVLAQQPSVEQHRALALQAQRQRPLRWVLLASLLVSGLGGWWLA